MALGKTVELLEEEGSPREDRFPERIEDIEASNTDDGGAEGEAGVIDRVEAVSASAFRATESVMNRLQLIIKAQGIFDELMAEVGGTANPYPEEVGVDDSRLLQGKAYLGKNFLYIFGKSEVRSFGHSDLLRALEEFKFDDEELAFISEYYLGGSHPSEIVQQVIAETPYGSKSVLEGLVSTLYESALGGLRKFFGEISMTDKALEKHFV